MRILARLMPESALTSCALSACVLSYALYIYNVRRYATCALDGGKRACDLRLQRLCAFIMLSLSHRCCFARALSLLYIMCVCVCMCVYVFVCVCVCMYVCVCVCVLVIYIYIYNMYI